MHQGRCSLPADDASRFLDRLAGLEQVIRPEDIQQALAATGRVNSRKCLIVTGFGDPMRLSKNSSFFAVSPC